MKIGGFANSEIAAEVKAAVLYRDYDNPVQKIADMLGLKARTVYDYFDGNIKISLPFLHACLIVTGGDPDVKKFLCPEGWELVPSGIEAPTTDIEKEMSDVYLAAADLQLQIRAAKADGKITPDERARIDQAMNNVRTQLSEVKSLVGGKNNKVLKIA